MNWSFLDTTTVEAIHDRNIQQYGGAPGLRDRGLLESAVLRAENKANYDPDATVGSVAASMSYGLIKNHAFIDGNKRIGLAALNAFLTANGINSQPLNRNALKLSSASPPARPTKPPGPPGSKPTSPHFRSRSTSVAALQLHTRAPTRQPQHRRYTLVVMRHTYRNGFALAATLLLSAAVADTSGCAAASSASACTETPFISPTSVTLDHTVPGNSQTFTTGTKYTGSCAVPQFLLNYSWNVSDPIDATVTVTNGLSTISCVNASAAPITVYSSIMGFSGSPLVATNTPTNLPSATLICK